MSTSIGMTTRNKEIYLNSMRDHKKVSKVPEENHKQCLVKTIVTSDSEKRSLQNERENTNFLSIDLYFKNQLLERKS